MQTNEFNGWGEPDHDLYHESPDSPRDDDHQPEPPRFTVHDEATAAWAVGKINEARAILAQREQSAAEWVAQARREVERLEARFLAELEAWGRQNLPANKRSIVLQSGKLEFRTKPARFALVRPEEALPWAKAHLPEAVVVKESVSADALTKYAQTGEVPPGVELIPAGETFKIR